MAKGDPRPQNGRGRPHQRHHVHCERRGEENLLSAVQQHDAAGDHRRRVDEGRNRRRASHSVRQPHKEGELRRLAARAHKEQQRDHRRIKRLARKELPDLREQDVVAQPAAIDNAKRILVLRGQHDQPEHPERETDVTNAVNDERLVGGRRVLEVLVPKADEQIGAQTNPFPADEQHGEVVAQHQHQHQRDKQVEVGEEPGEIGLLRHVADGVEVDERTNASDDQHHRHRERVHPELKRDRNRLRANPLKQSEHHGSLRFRLAHQLQGHRQRDEERQRNRRHAQSPADAAAQLGAERVHHDLAAQGLEQRSEEREGKNPPNQLVIHRDLLSSSAY